MLPLRALLILRPFPNGYQGFLPIPTRLPGPSGGLFPPVPVIPDLPVGRELRAIVYGSPAGNVRDAGCPLAVVYFCLILTCCTWGGRKGLVDLSLD